MVDFVTVVAEYAQAFIAFWKGLDDIFKWLIGGVPAAAAIGWKLAKGWAFLARYHHDGGLYGYIATLPSFLRIFWENPRGVFSTESARLLTEVEILAPHEERPRRWDLPSRRDWRAAKAEWRSQHREWKHARNETLRRLITKNKSKRQRRVTEEKLATYPIIEVRNPAVIDDARDKIARYFAVGQKYDITEFVSYAHLRYGYFAPLFLIRGLMTRFKDDWGPIINNYRSQLQDAAPYSRELLELKSFEFNCWLLWGPSVPLCNCEAWCSEHGMSSERGSENPLFYQYGFGDENNSLDVYVVDGRAVDFKERVAKSLIQPALDGSADAGKPRYVCAAPKSLLGRVALGARLPGPEVCAAQAIIRDEDYKRVFLAFEGFSDSERGLKPSAYYSAYIWLMFMVEDGAGSPVYPGFQLNRGEHEKPYPVGHWKNLLPFFEHGNIADATTMQTLKMSLVAKTCAAVDEILRRPEDRSVVLRYACAFDHANCGHEDGIMFPPREQSTTILELLQRALEGHAGLAAARASGRLILPGDRAPRPADALFSSCHLPDVVEMFYAEMTRSEKERVGAAAAQA